MSAATPEPPTTSAGPSENTSPPPPLASAINAQQVEQWKSALAQLVKTSKMNRSRGSSLAEKPEVQAMLDKDLFLIQSDRRTRMNPLQQLQMVRVLAQFFLERVDDGHRYSYFEAVFLGRSDDPMLHEYRISVMFQLVSFSAQYPCLQIFNHVMGWLCQMKNDDLERQYSDRLLTMIIDQFVRTSSDKNPLHQFLGPLEVSCSEFCALFVARAPLLGAMKPPMAELIVRYCTKNMQFVLRHLRDTPWLGNEFADKVVPMLMKQSLEEGFGKEADGIVSCLCYILLRWHIDVLASGERRGPNRRIEVLDLLLSPKFAWTKRRICILTCAIGATSRSEVYIQKMLRETNPPPQFKPAVALLSSGGVKENTQKFLDTVSDMRMEDEKFDEHLATMEG